MRNLTYKNKQANTIRNITESSQQVKQKAVSQLATKLAQNLSPDHGMVRSQDVQNCREKAYSIFTNFRSGGQHKITGIFDKYRFTSSSKGKPVFETTRSMEKKLAYNKRCPLSPARSAQLRKKSLLKLEKTPHRQDKSLQIIRVNNEVNLMGSITDLRRFEKDYIWVQQDQDQLCLRSTKVQWHDSFSSNTRRKLAPKQCGLNEERACVDVGQLKQKIKLKLSRRHFYHTLRNKTEEIKKGKFKRIPVFSMKNKINPEAFSPQPIHFSTNRSVFRHISLHHARLQDLPCQNEQDLRVEPMQAQLQRSKADKQMDLQKNDCMLRWTQQQRSKSISNPIRQARWGETANMTQTKSYQLQSKAVSEQVTGGPRSWAINIFRELTPWHQEEID